MNLWKRLKSKVTGELPESNKQTSEQHPLSHSGGEGKGEGAPSEIPNKPESASTLQPFNASTSADNRTGKIARLPRPLRERINHALYNRYTARQIACKLNNMPEVKAVLAEHFGGRPISTQNIYEWKWGGYRDWLRRQEILENKRELAADAKDLAKTAPDMADSLFGMVTLDYAQLMMNRDKDDSEQFEKRRKGLSTLAQDIVRLYRCRLNARRVQVQETKLDNETEKTEEQLLSKFTEWTAIPEVRKALILAPMERDRRMREMSDLPPTPEDILVEKETRDDPYFGRSASRRSEAEADDENKTGSKPNKTKKSNPESKPSSPSGSEKTPESNDHERQPTAVPSPLPSDGRGEGQGEVRVSAADGADPLIHSSANPPIRVEGESRASTLEPSNPSTPALNYAGKSTQELIAEAEDNYAREKAARLHRRQKNETEEAPVPQPKPKPEPSPYEKALREGKTFEEAMYAQFAPVEKPKENQPVQLEPDDFEPIRRASRELRARIVAAEANPLSALQPPPGFYGPCGPPLTLSSPYNFHRPRGPM